MTNTRLHIRLRPARQERGIAMLMVIIALGAATVLSGAYLASRRNTGAIGQNAMLAIRAQWASRSALEMGMAVMQSNANWRNAASDGVLIDDLDLSGAEVRVVVTNLEGQPPETDDEDLVLTAIALVSGVESSVQRVVTAPSNQPVAAALNPTLDEFGVFAVETLEVKADGVIATWPLAPRAALKAPVKIGLANGYNSALAVDSGAHLVNAIAYAPSYASASLRTMLESQSFANSELLTVMPPALLAVGTGFDSLSDSGGVNEGTGGNGNGNGNGNGIGKGLAKKSGPGDDSGGTLNTGQAKKEARLSGKSVTALASGAYTDVEIKSNAVVELAGDYSIERLTVLNGGELRILDDTRIELIEDAEFRDSGTLTFANDQARVELFLRDGLLVRNTALGSTVDVANDIGRSIDSLTAYQDPGRLRIYSAIVPPDPLNFSVDEDPVYEFDDSALVVAAVHAPSAEIRIRDDSAVIGRVTALRLIVESTAIVLTDPMLDNRAGFTSPNGRLYKSNGDPIDGLENALASLDPNIGIEGMPGYVEPLVTPEDPLAAWVDDGSGLTPRRAMFAQPTQWPLTAMTFEADRTDGATTVNDGSIIKMDSLLEIETLLRLDPDLSGAVSSTKSTLLKIADPNLLQVKLQ